MNSAPCAGDVDGALRAALAGDERVATALLFGSVASGTSRAGSDVDVAILARDAAAAQALRGGHLDLVAALSLATGRDVQVVLLDDVEPVLGRQVFLHARTLVERDPALTARCLERILGAYFDGAYHRRLMGEALDARLAARGRP
jgi:predicted nucleotidyltransferase